LGERYERTKTVASAGKSGIFVSEAAQDPAKKPLITDSANVNRSVLCRTRRIALDFFGCDIMTKVIVSTCIVAAILAGNGCTADISSADNKDWTPLFNGIDLEGWIVKCNPADSNKQFWRVEDGAILADSMGVAKHDYVWLLTNRQYGDFILRLRFQAFRDSPGNSGIQLRSRYDDQANWLDGPQMDIHPPGPWRTGMIWDETRDVNRWLYPDVPKGKWVDPSMANSNLVFYFSDTEPGWNELEITAFGTRLTARLNGVEIMDYDGTGVLDDEIHKARRVGMVGHIALQIHRNDELKIRFKDIYVKDLSK